MKRKKVYPTLLTVEEVAEYMGLKKQTIYNWLHSKKLRGLKIGKVWRFEKKAIDEWLKKMEK